MSVSLISLHLDALILGEDCFPHGCLDKPIVFYLYHGLSQALVFNLHFFLLVNLFASWL